MTVLSANIVAKAARLHEQGRVVPLGVVAFCDDGGKLPLGRTDMYSVRGDNGTYAVLIAPSHVACSCAAYRTCSHIAAALLLGLREQHASAIRSERPTRHRRPPLSSARRSSIQPTAASR